MTIAEWIDRGVALASSVPKMFEDGWGDPNLLEDLVERASHVGDPPDIEIKWREGGRRKGGPYLFEGYFESPLSHLPLPPESCTAYFQLLLPEGAFEGERPPLCVHLAGTGDPTYIGRRLLAGPHVRNGIGALLLENPYYGYRRPEGQTGTKLRRVSDQLLMNLATIEETRGLLKWFCEDGYRHLGVSGYSMGGYLAAFVAEVTEMPIAAIPCATGESAIEPFVLSSLSRIFDWDTLEEEMEDGEYAQDRMASLLSFFSLSEHGQPTLPEAAVIVGARHDDFIPPEEVVALHRHWEGSELRWIEGGHTTGWLLHTDVIRSAITDAFERLKTAMESHRV